MPSPLSNSAEESLLHVAFHDTLTDLPNRALLSEQLEEALAHAVTLGQRTAVLFIDLDGFKTVNDTLGHQAGDKLLVEVASRFQASVRQDDVVARFGGDEFVVVLKNIRDGDPERIAESILHSLSHAIQLDQREVHVGASIGVAVAPRDGANPEELLRNADNALYRAKDAGRGTVQTFTPTMHLMSSARLLMEEGLRKAVVREELFLEYQPICSAVNGKTVAAEALIRWRHPLRDVVLPHEFIPLAEEAGIIEEIGRWSIRHAISQVGAWIDAGIDLPKISLNVSAREFRHKSFVANLLQAFAGSEVAPGAFQLELTESMAVEELETALPKLAALRDAGFTLALDDFGKGYSSLSQLKRLPFSVLKVDNLFVREISVNQEDQRVLQAIVTLGHTFGMTVCVEGIETDAQEEVVRQSGCDSMQGHCFAYPLSSDAFVEYIRTSG